MARAWRVVGNFHSVGEVVVFVEAPNWVGGLRKGALAIKREPRMKGKRLTVGAFTVQEIDSIPVAQMYEQLPIPASSGEGAEQVGQVTQPGGPEASEALPPPKSEELE